MKKSKKIQLVLITAALSSCSRVVIPNEPLQSCLADTSLSKTPVDWTENPIAAVDPYYELNYEPTWFESFYLRPVYSHPEWTPFLHPGPWVRQPVVGGETVVRAGFGISAKAVTIGS